MSLNDKTDGNHLWRNGEHLAVEKEPDCFTTLVGDPEDVERIRAIGGVHEVREVQPGVARINVEAERRDEVMSQVRAAQPDGPAGVAHHAYRPAQAAGTRYYLTDRVVVRFRPEVSNEQVNAIFAEEGVVSTKEYGDHTYLVRVTSDADRNPLKVANSLATRSEVDYAEPNLVNRFQPSYIPADPYFPRQWHLHAEAGPEIVAGADISAPKAWDLANTGNRSVVVAVVDDGFDLTHPDLTGPDKIVFPTDYVDGDSSPFPSKERGDYHGTPCAGVAIAEENGEGVVGVAPACSFMPVRFPLSADDDTLWEIFDYVGARADVISCSWGPPPVYAPLGRLMHEKLSTLAGMGGPHGKGCVIVFAAGNYDAPLRDPTNDSFWWRHSNGLQETRGPILNGNATHPNVIAVAACTSLKRKAAYSNWGQEISLCAPSSNFDPLDSRVRRPGRGIWTTDNGSFGSSLTPFSRFTGEFGGTSSAAPLVAGVAALVRAANPCLTATEVKEIMEATADKIIDTEPDPVLGLTKDSYDATGKNEWFGNGRVNAAEAVQRALELVMGRPLEPGAEKEAGAAVAGEAIDVRRSQYVIGGRDWNDLSGGVLDALKIPPAYLSSLLGAPWTWLPPHHRYSEFGLLDVWRPVRALAYLADVVVPSVPLTPPSFTPPLLPPILQRLFWHPSLVLQRGDHNNNYTSHPDEAWFFVNGIMTNDALAQLNAAYLTYLFHRPITLIQNSTGGLAEDLLECAIDKAWSWTRTGEAATKAFPVVYDALKDPFKTRVVLISHSQGTIIASVVLRYMQRLGELRAAREPAFRVAEPEPVPLDDTPLDLADFDPLEPKEMAKLEVYCFANCATTMRYVTTQHGASVPWIESYGNEFDIVARLGVLAPNPAKRGVQIDGPLYKRKGAWGHLLGDHYLLGIEREQRKDRKRGPKTQTAAPYILLNPYKFPDHVPRLYQYLNGGEPRGGVESVAT